MLFHHSEVIYMYLFLGKKEIKRGWQRAFMRCVLVPKLLAWCVIGPKLYRCGMHDWTCQRDAWFLNSRTCDAWFTLKFSVIDKVSLMCFVKPCDAWWLKFLITMMCAGLQKISVMLDRYSPLCHPLKRDYANEANIVNRESL